MTHTQKNTFHASINFLVKRDENNWHELQQGHQNGLYKGERLLKSKMASSDDRVTFEIVHVLRFGNMLKGATSRFNGLKNLA